MTSTGCTSVAMFIIYEYYYRRLGHMCLNLIFFVSIAKLFSITFFVQDVERTAADRVQVIAVCQLLFYMTATCKV